MEVHRFNILVENIAPIPNTKSIKASEKTSLLDPLISLELFTYLCRSNPLLKRHVDGSE
jgi:hypothetical protein